MAKRKRPASAPKRRAPSSASPGTTTTTATSQVSAFELAPLESFDPRLLVRDEHDRIGELVLALALWFNDLKDLLLAWETVTLKKPGPDAPVVSAENGQFIGLRTHILRFAFGALHELLEFLTKNRAALDHEELRRTVESMPPKAQASWLLLVGHVDRKPRNGATASLRSVIARIRNGIAFHYYHPSDLVDGYRRHFDRAAKEAHRTDAYWSLGNNAETSRFYFADAAAQAALETRLSVEGVDVMSALEASNQAVRMVVETFIRRRQVARTARSSAGRRAGAVRGVPRRR